MRTLFGFCGRCAGGSKVVEYFALPPGWFMAQLLKLSETAASASAGKRRVVNTGSSFIAVSLSQPVEFTNAFFIAQCLGLRFNSLMKPCLLISALVLAVSFLNAETPKEFVLFDGKSLDDWQLVDSGGSGQVEARDGELLIGSGESLTGTIYKKAKDLPLTNYEITLDAKRTEGNDFFVGLTFPVGDLKTAATLICGGWGGSVTGISSIDNMDASENSTGHYRKFEDNKWYHFKLRVTPESISVWVGEEKAIDVDIKGKKISLRPGPIEAYAPLSFTTYQTSAAIKNVKLTPITVK